MQEDAFVMKNREKWEALEAYNQLFTYGSLSKSDPADIRRFAELYRLASHHLAYSRTCFGDSKTTQYLNQLVSVSHNQFYIKKKFSLSVVKQYFLHDFRKLIHDNRLYILAAGAVFCLAFLAIGLLGSVNRGYINYFFSESQQAGVNLDPKEGSYYATMSAFIMTNNIRVCILSVAWGITAGIGTLYVLFQNGAVIGALWAHIFTSTGDLFMPSFWALILPHGIFELFAIFISGGAGLIIGKSFLIPKDLSRKNSVIKGAKTAAMLMPGVVVMLIVAGLIEGFFTPLNIPVPVKLSFAMFTLALLILYCGVYKPRFFTSK